MATWWQKELERVAQQGAVALGLMTEEEAKADDQLSAQELTRRFITEACAIKDPKRQAGPFGIPSCTTVQVEDGRRCGPAATSEDIGETMRIWQERLDSKATPEALDALLQSRALDVVLKALPTSKAGRLTIQEAAEWSAKHSRATSMRIVLCRCSAVPDTFLGQILQLFSEASRQSETARQTGRDASIAERGLQWVFAILSAGLYDTGEATLNKSGRMLELFGYAIVELDKFASGTASVMTCEQKLESTETLSSSFVELKVMCEQLKESSGLLPVADVTKILTAVVDSLTALRTENEIHLETIDPVAVQAVFREAGTASREVEANLEQRLEKSRRFSSVLTALPQHRPDVEAVSQEVEKLRGQRLQDAIYDLDRDLWGPEAFDHSPEKLADLRTLITRAEHLVTEAWRERMHYAAETLDDVASARAASYKEMRQELQKSMGRLSKMEGASKLGGSVAKPDKMAAQAPSKPPPSRIIASIDKATLTSVAALRRVLQIEAAMDESSGAKKAPSKLEDGPALAAEPTPPAAVATGSAQKPVSPVANVAPVAADAKPVAEKPAAPVAATTKAENPTSPAVGAAPAGDSTVTLRAESAATELPSSDSAAVGNSGAEDAKAGKLVLEYTMGKQSLQYCSQPSKSLREDVVDVVTDVKGEDAAVTSVKGEDLKSEDRVYAEVGQAEIQTETPRAESLTSFINRSPVVKNPVLVSAATDSSPTPASPEAAATDASPTPASPKAAAMDASSTPASPKAAATDASSTPASPEAAAADASPTPASPEAASPSGKLSTVMETSSKQGPDVESLRERIRVALDQAVASGTLQSSLESSKSQECSVS